MKTAILIPEDIVEPVQELTQRTGITINELCIFALREYLERRRKRTVTAKINAVCDKVDTGLDLAIHAMQALSIPKEEW